MITYAATVHNAKRVTFDGRSDCWIAFLYAKGSDQPYPYSSEHKTKDEAVKALEAELRRRGLADVKVSVLDQKSWAHVR